MTEPENSISARVVKAVARANGTDVEALPPLYEAIEPDALNSLYAYANADEGMTRGGDSDPTVMFSYAGYEVCVRSQTDIEVREQTVGSTDPTEP